MLRSSEYKGDWTDIVFMCGGEGVGTTHVSHECFRRILVTKEIGLSILIPLGFSLTLMKEKA